MNLINFYRPLQDGLSVALPEKTFTSSPFQGTQGTSAIQELHRRDLFPSRDSLIAFCVGLGLGGVWLPTMVVLTGI
jgi:hypothetical protein